MTREALLSCPFTDAQLASPQGRDELGVSAFCTKAITQYCLYDCRFATLFVLRSDQKSVITYDDPMDDLQERGNPDSKLLGC